MQGFFTKRRKISNSLTLLFENKTPTLDKVLENSDLSISLRYEVDELVDFIVPKECDPQKCPNLVQILDYALPLTRSKINPQLIYRRNAANILSTICNKLQTRIHTTNLLKNRIEEFITKKNSNVNEFAGHFQRITECFLRFEIRTENKKPLNNFHAFLINILSKISILAYRFLAINIFSEFIDIINKKESSQNEMKLASQIISKSIDINDDLTIKYNHISMFFYIYQQNEAIFTDFDINCLNNLFDTALMLSNYNQLYAYESFRIIDLLISQLNSPNVNINILIDRYAEKQKKYIISLAKSSIFNCCVIFRIFWKVLLNSKTLDVMKYFFEDPYNHPNSEVNWFFYIKVVDVFSKMDSQTRYFYVRSKSLCTRAINYMKKLEKYSTPPNFCILELIELISQPLKDDEYKLSLNPNEEKNPMLSPEWAEAVFTAKTILLKKRDAVDFAKKDFIQKDDFFM